MDEEPRFYSAAQEGLCLIYKVILEIYSALLQVQTRPLRAKCLGFQACLPPLELPSKVIPHPIGLRCITPMKQLSKFLNFQFSMCFSDNSSSRQVGSSPNKMALPTDLLQYPFLKGPYIQ
ncbi:hypothetical protein NPIL_527481 [Nephila pilipes]|uniref:Uncharacterized protein n=1 Tax=Nephila pilipes TaxID=299642 RepID=A0A8X6MGX6_NEPPI|nr:hypothetical protein NPIL_527481 [Nephila pilipes]